ncbi:MAG: ATP-grasp domain-containing protein [Gammaproteobacteria bacterium]|nr:ATP-grasp domain-containing protein [Gammaproteobacteria bacterium]
MKNIFVCEFITCGGMHSVELPVSLVQDADIMVQALITDLQRVPDLEVFTCRDSRLSPIVESRQSIKENDDVPVIWQALMLEADLIWIIAPESNGELLRLTEMARTCGGLVIACSPEAIRLASSKMNTYEFLRSKNYIVPETRYLGEALVVSDTGWVIKPDDGAGSEDCYLFEDEQSIKHFARSGIDSRTFIQQAFLKGIHLSLSALVFDSHATLLSCNYQDCNKQNHRLRNRLISRKAGGDCEKIFETLIEDMAKNISGLKGYIGIDIVLNEQGSVILDINPRLTTSYAGLSELLGFNVAELILENFIKYECR